MKSLKDVIQSLNKSSNSYAQHWHLLFKNPSNEKRFATELLSHQKTSITIIYICTIFVIAWFLSRKEITCLRAFLLCLSAIPFLLVKIERSFIHRIFTEIIAMQFILATINTGSICECVCAFIPSSILNYYFLKTWIYSFIMNILEILLVYLLRDVEVFNILCAVFCHIFWIVMIERDMKIAWALYHSQKDKCNKFESLLQGPENSIIIAECDRKGGNSKKEKEVFSKVKLKEDRFSIHIELASFIDEIFNKASSKEITIIYTRESSVPPCILGDKSLYLHILRCLFGYALDYSSCGTELLFHLKGPSSYTDEYGIEFQISFHSEKVTQDGLNKIFLNSESLLKPKFIETPSKINSKLLIFSLILELLKGRVNHCLYTSSKSRAVLSVFIPIKTSDKWIETTFVPTHSHPEIAPNNSIKWKPEKSKIGAMTRFQRRKSLTQAPEYLEYLKKYSTHADNGYTIQQDVMETLSDVSNSSSANFSQECDEDVRVGPCGVSYSKTYAGVLSTIPKSSLVVPMQNSKSMPESPWKHKNGSLKVRRVYANSKNNYSPLPDYKFTDSRPTFCLLAEDTNENKSLKCEVGAFKVLIVDDMASHREFLEANLGAITHINAEHAKDGNEAWKMYEAYAKSGYMYRVIFMDLMMPKMDGYKSTQKIREIEKQNGYPKTLICGMSGDKEAKEKCVNAGMDEFLIKPPQISEVKAILKKAGAEF
ncbi:unnamed protein product [Blepharisma stoltei]|uniref:Response regulatory domain-containing protein n=1 Tax=Blepharisma stoltei TaxID=1481888 RepID=A0AAU9JMN0_9CILI|nr:unnamed protein product [Blepharisma stoltei]